MSDNDDVTSRLLNAAHAYRNRGWRVIQLHFVGPDGLTCSCREGRRCENKGKHPRDNGWQKTEAYSAADIETLWAERPKANVGIATGTPSGVWVLDLDPKDDGVENFGKLIGEHGGEFPATYAVETGSGGYHYYFTMPDFEVRNSVSKLAHGVDVRGTGGQVVAPPSHSDKGAYTVIRDVRPVAAPGWLLDLIRPKDRDVTVVTTEDLPKPEEISAEEWDRLNTYAHKALESELSRLDRLHPAVWNGRDPWNHTTFEVCCAVLEFANSPWNAYSVGKARNDVFTRAPRDADGFDNYVIQKTWNSAVEKVGNKARPIPVSRDQEEDPLFSGPDVRRKEAPKPDPTGGPSTRPGAGGPSRFFGERNEIDVHLLADAVAEMGPLAWGRDEAFWSYENGVWIPDGEVVTNRCIDLLRGKFRLSHAANTAAVVKRYAIKLTGDPLPQFMNFKNGMLDWQTGELLEHDPNFKSTVQFPLDYNPDATCPTFDQFLDDVMHEDYIALAWEMMGYLMFSGNPLQVAFLLYGSGGNGKGTLIRVIEEILGLQNVSSESLDALNSNRFSAVNLFGRIANIAGDIDGTYQEHTANFKKLTGEDTYAAERKFGQRFTFESWAVPVFSANKIPGSADVTEGYLRRWVVLHFHKTIPPEKRIMGLSNLLSTEIEGIAAKAIPALRALMQRNQFDPKGEAKKGKQEFAEAIDQVRQWLAYGGPSVQRAPETWTPLQALYVEYSHWAIRAGVTKLREQEFGHRLEAAGFDRKLIEGVAHHQGLHVEAQQHNSPASFF